MKHLVAVYGSLMSGMRNHNLLSDARFVGKGGFKGSMYSLGAFPGVNLSGEGLVSCEIWEVDDATLRHLDWLESHPDFYRRVRVDVAGQDCWVYEWPHENTLKIDSGDWREYEGRS